MRKYLFIVVMCGLIVIYGSILLILDLVNYPQMR